MLRLSQKSVKSFEYGYTLIEILFVLFIIGVTLTLGAFAVIKFKQVIEVSNAAKELVLKLQEARRFALDSVITTTKETAGAYYIEIGTDNEYYWGECSEGMYCAVNPSTSIKSAQYKEIIITSDCAGSTVSQVIFLAGTGEFVFKDSSGNDIVANECIIEFIIPGGINTRRKINVNSMERTIKIEV
jgi:prepilin-type N-terminal cleavage/methylation domain-containing protein